MKTNSKTLDLMPRCTLPDIRSSKCFSPPLCFKYIMKRVLSFNAFTDFDLSSNLETKLQQQSLVLLYNDQTPSLNIVSDPIPLNPDDKNNFNDPSIDLLPRSKTYNIPNDRKKIKSLGRKGSLDAYRQAKHTEEVKDAMLHIHLCEAKGLPQMDVLGEADPFVEFIIKGNDIQKSSVIKKTREPFWNEYFTMALKKSQIDYDLEIVVWDWDFWSANDRIGHCIIPLSTIMNKEIIWDWFQIFDVDNPSISTGFINIKLAWQNEFVPFKERKNDAFAIKRSHFMYSIPHPIRYEEFQIFIGSWNCGNAPPPDDLNPWIPRQSNRFVIIGTQECNYSPRPEYKTCEEDFISSLSKHLGSNYQLVEFASLWQMRIAVFIESHYSHYVTNIHKNTEATGIAHVMGNKGGVAISFNYFDTSFCFVNSHLAAHQNKSETRNDNYSEIIEGLSPGGVKLDILSKFNYLFWMGDLNYRLDFGNQKDAKTPEGEQFKTMVQMVQSKQYSELFQYDQLKSQQRQKKAFVGFTEGEYNFPPTFKVLRDAKLEYNEKRSPAWCDRILWKNMMPQCITPMKQTSFDTALEIRTSDHKPVFSTFVLKSLVHPCGFDNRFNSASLQIRNVHATDLRAADVNGKSDPYLVIQSPVLEKEFTSSVVFNTLDPVWNELIKLPCKYTNFGRFIPNMLYFTLMDKDVGSADDDLGYVTLSLGLLRPNEWSKFDLEVSYTGLPAGHLMFEIKPAFIPSNNECKIPQDGEQDYASALHELDISLSSSLQEVKISP